MEDVSTLLRRFDGLKDLMIEKEADRKPPGIVAQTIRGGRERWQCLDDARLLKLLTR
jgi:hypothetical protein